MTRKIQRPKGEYPERWVSWKAIEPFTRAEQRANAAELRCTLKAYNDGTWSPGDDLVNPQKSTALSKKRKRESASSAEGNSSSSAPSSRPQRACKKSSRQREAEEDAVAVAEEAGPPPKKRKSTTAPPTSSPSSPPSSPPPRRATKPAKAAKNKARPATAKKAPPEPFTTREYAWVHQLKVDDDETHSWDEIAAWMNARQGHRRTGGAFQASYSRQMTKLKKQNGGNIPIDYTSQGQYALSSAPPPRNQI